MADTTTTPNNVIPATTQGAGLINTAPGSTTTDPGVTPAGNSGPGAPVTSYTPQTAQSSQAQAASYSPNAFNVSPDQTTAGQLNKIIASGSPLMQQAEANAREQMNQRGLINSSMGVGASEQAMIAAATPIAQSDANVYAQAATNTTQAQNAALAAGAQATNTANLQNANLSTQTSQFNAGQGNAAMSQAAGASNTVAVTAQQIAGSKDIQELQSNTQKAIAQLQSDTTLSAQDRANQSAQIIASMNDANAQILANIQADTSLSVEDKQAAEQSQLAAMNNANAQVLQEMQNAGNLANIQANGVINTQITNLTDQNKLLLQSSSGAAQLYGQALQNFSNIINNANMSADDKAAALNDGVQQLNDALSVLSIINGTPSVQSTLTFGNGGANAANAPTTQSTDVFVPAQAA